MNHPIRILSLVCLGLLAAGPATAAANPPVLPIGAPLPDFALPGVDGKIHTPADYAAAKVLMIVFTCNHCPTAQAYEGRLKRLAAEYGPQGVAVVAINPNHAAAVRLDEMGYGDLGDSFEEMVIRHRDHAWNFPYLDDGDTQAVTRQFGAVATPHVYLFGPDRTLAFQGRIDNAEREDLATAHDTRAALDAVLAGREPAVKTTRVFGCSVKWKDKVEDNLRWRAKVAREPVSLEQVDVAGLKALRANAGSGKIRLVNVWATWCGPCVSEFDELLEQNLRFRHRAFEMVTVAAQYPDEEAKVLAFLQEHKASVRNLIFGVKDKYACIEALDPEWNGELPYTLLIGTQGEILYRESGSIDFLALRRAIFPALEPITPWVNGAKVYER